MMKLFLISIVLFVGSSKATETTLADDLFATGEYNAASVEYLRLLYGQPDSSVAQKYHVNLARCYLAQHKYALLQQLSHHAVAGSPLFLLQARALLEQKRYAAAVAYLKGSDTPMAHYLLGYALFHTGTPQLALQEFSAFTVDDSLYYLSHKVTQFLSAPLDIKHKSYTMAAILSFLPGVGHLYTGRKGDAWYAASIIVGFGGLAYYYHLNDAPVRTKVIGGFGCLFQLSSMYGALAGVRLWNREQRRAYVQRFEKVYRGTDMVDKSKVEK